MKKVMAMARFSPGLTLLMNELGDKYGYFKSKENG